MQKDNTTLREKVALRRALLAELAEPAIVCETHGGVGAIYRACYAMIPCGVVFEKDDRKASILAGQRPTWAVYESDCEKAIAAGAGAHLLINYLDIDPYGSPWEVLRAWFTSDRPRAPRLALAVNDGLRMKVRAGGAWNCAILRSAVARFGNDLFLRYLEVCRWMIVECAKPAGYRLAGFRGHYTGTYLNITHYTAILELTAETPTA